MQDGKTVAFDLIPAEAAGAAETATSATTYRVQISRDADQLDRVPDAMLEQFLIATGWHRSPHEPNATATTRMLRERAAARIAAVKDNKLRRDLQERFRLDRAS